MGLDALWYNAFSLPIFVNKFYLHAAIISSSVLGV